LVVNFRRSVIIAELWRSEVVRRKKYGESFEFFGKTTPYGKILNSVAIVFIATLIDVLCSNFVKFGRREVGEIVRCLHDKNSPGSPTVAILRGSRQKSVRVSLDNVLKSAPDFIQIGSLSAEL